MAIQNKTSLKSDPGPGVPEAIPQMLLKISRQLKTETMETLWIFPPLINKRKEWGLIAIGCYTEGDSRLLYTARYSARREGSSISLDAQISEEGEAPVDSLPRVMAGVVKRSKIDLGSPKTYMIEGRNEKFQTLLTALEAKLMEVVEL